MNLKLPKDWRFYARYIGLGLLTATGLWYAWYSQTTSKTFWIGIIIASISCLLFIYFFKKETLKHI